MSTASRHRLLSPIVTALFACLAAQPACAQRGALTVPRNLDQLVDRAADIVRGTIVSAHVEKHPTLRNLDTVVVTLKVHETLKGSARGTYTFRQYIWDVRDNYDAAGYLKGQHVLLMLLAPSRYGLTSPAGLDQGRFRITRDQSGREIATNGQGNSRLFDGLQAEASKEGVVLSRTQAKLAATHRQGPVDVRDLAALIRLLAQGDAK